MQKWKKVTGTLIVMGVLVAFALSGTVMAQPAPAAPGTQNYYNLFTSKLASILGMDQAQVQKALTQAGEQTLDEAVQQGWLPSEQAARVKEKMANGQWWCFPQKMLGCGKAMHHEDYLQTAAEILGISSADLKARLEKGETLNQIVQEKGLDPAQFSTQMQEKMLAAGKQKLDEAVKQGKLTQAQADQIWEKMQQRPGKGEKKWIQRNGKGPKALPQANSPQTN